MTPLKRLWTTVAIGVFFVYTTRFCWDYQANWFFDVTGFLSLIGAMISLVVAIIFVCMLGDE